MVKSTSIVRALVIINTLWLLFYSSSCPASYSLVLLSNRGSPTRSLDAIATTDSSRPIGNFDARGPVGLTPVQHNLKFLAKFPGLPACEQLGSEPKDIDVTLVTQTSLERLHVMEDICKRWTGPISIVVANVNLTQSELQDRLVTLGCAAGAVASSVYKEPFKRKKYPVNILRNMALRQANSSHAIYLDIDLVPSKNLYEDILHHKDLLRKNNKYAIVVPAFQLNPTPECQDNDDLVGERCSELLRDFLPETKDQLLQHYGHPFEEPEPRIYQFTGREHYYGHSSTGYEAWVLQTPLHTVEPIECLKSVRYEPYVVVRLCEDLPPYQEQFTGYGKNKVSWMWQMQRSGYHFFRLGSGFTIHYPHPVSRSKMSWSSRKKTMGRHNLDVEQIARAFREWLEEEVHDQGTLPYCESYEQRYS